ncbi:MAG TPA: ParB N-terminal domain-containing protein [Deltaproteobacteria bacterium]|nr:ParB N-terminal domain-containing protein [Deltaproteobacteria bacterium]
MEYKAETVTIDQIDENDLTYRITTQTNNDDLAASIKEIGVLNSPIIEKRDADAHFIILSGFRRINACKALKVRQIKARIASSKLTQLDRAKIAISENSFQRALNPIETSRALNLLSGLMDNKDRLSKTASRFALPGNPKLIDSIMQLTVLPDPIQQTVISGTVGLPVALHLGKMEKTVALMLLEIFENLKFSLNKQRELILFSEEISQREDKALIDVLKDPRIDAIINNKDMDRSQKGRELRRYLKQRRFPELSHAESVFEKEKKALKLENQIRFQPPLHFEGETYTFQFQFRTVREYKKRLETLNRLVDHASFTKIMTRP